MVTRAVVLAVFMTFGTLAVGGAALITVDGDLSEWAGLDGVWVGESGERPGVKNDGYDIKYTRNVWDPDSGYTFFNMETWGPLTPPEGDNFVALMIDADNDPDTGTLSHSVPGSEYRLLFDLSYGLPGDLSYGPFALGHNYYFQELTGSGWSMIDDPGDALLVSRGTEYGDYIEWGIRADLIDVPSGFFTWGVHLDDMGTYEDDFVIGQKGQVPEPTTLALFALGAAGMYIRRRYGSKSA